MGNRLVIPNADFSSIGTKSIKTQKIELNDDDFIYGWPKLDTTDNHSYFRIIYESNDVKNLNHTLPGFTKLSNINAFSGTESIGTHATKNCKTFIFTIPDNAIAVGGLFQEMINVYSSSTSANGYGGFYCNDSKCVDVTKGYWNCLTKDNMQIDSEDSFDTIRYKIQNQFKDYSNIWSKAWPYFKILDVYDRPVGFNNDTTQQWIGMICDAIFMIPSNSKYFIKTISFPSSYTYLNNSDPINPLINTGFTESHLYWIFG